jgi:putative membrane protein
MSKKKQVKKVEAEEKTVKEEKNNKITKMDIKHKFFEIFLYVLSYSITLLLLSKIFKNSIELGNPEILFAVIASIIIYALNQVVRPILVTLTMPITGLTFGLFYFVINCFLLKITDWVMLGGLNFPRILDYKHIWILFVISILLAILRFLIEDIILKPIIRKAFK